MITVFYLLFKDIVYFHGDRKKIKIEKSLMASLVHQRENVSLIKFLCSHQNIITLNRYSITLNIGMLPWDYNVHIINEIK